MSFIPRRFFTASLHVKSHIGSAPVFLTPETKFICEPMVQPKTIRKGNKSLILSQKVSVKGPLGEIKMEVPDFVKIKHDESLRKVEVSVDNSSDKTQKAMWGTIRSHINNHVTGVNEGHMAILKFVGTGYKAQVEKNEDGSFVNVKVGASIVQGLTIPENLNVTSPAPTSLIIEGINKQNVFLFAANLRKFHPPEPYKGKGIYVNNETIKLKDKKIK